MTMVDDINEMLSGGGGRTAKFPEIGTTYEGEILALAKREVRDMDTGAVETWNDGTTKYQIVVTIATDAREGADDDGARNVYCKGQLFTALRDAVKAAGSKLAVGGTLKVRYDSDGEASRKGFNAPKLYKVKYTPAPARSVDLEDF